MIVLLLLLLIIGIVGIRIGSPFFLIIFKSFLSGFFEELTLFAEIILCPLLLLLTKMLLPLFSLFLATISTRKAVQLLRVGDLKLMIANVATYGYLIIV